MERKHVKYEAEDSYATDAFKKFMFMKATPADLSSQSGSQMKMLINSSQSYLQDFKHVRDSEFSD